MCCAVLHCAVLCEPGRVSCHARHCVTPTDRGAALPPKTPLPHAASSACGHTSTVWAVAFEPGGARMASCSDDRTVRLWHCGSSSSSADAPMTDGAAAAGRRGSGNASGGEDEDEGGDMGDGDGGTGGTAVGAQRAVVRGRPPWRAGPVLSGYHERTVYSVDWSEDGLIATGGGRACVHPSCLRCLCVGKHGLLSAAGVLCFVAGWISCSTTCAHRHTTIHAIPYSSSSPPPS